jgi:hypothetical protein
VFSTPSLLLTPYFGLAGVIVGLRFERSRNFALFTLFLFGFQYVLYTFVFVLSPTPRYYSISVLLFCIFGGLFLSELSSSILRSSLLVIQLVAAGMIGLTQIGPQTIVKALAIDSQKTAPIYVTPQTADAAYLDLARDHDLFESVRLGFPPVGGLALIGWDGWPRDTWKTICEDGTPQWNVIETSTNPSLPWRVINAIYPNASSALPERITSYLRRDVENAVLVQRRC